MGYFVSKQVPYGDELPIADAEEHILAIILLNDWSARDLQLFERKPLGPFHGKGFGTSFSPWVVTLEALQPFHCPVKTPQKLPAIDHLRWPREHEETFDVKLRAELRRGGKAYTLSTSNLRYLCWTPFQQITRHASAMCEMNPGDLLGTGTISGDEVGPGGKKTELGYLYEATQAGTTEVDLIDGTKLKYLQDGDEVVLSAWCGDEDKEPASLGFGECRSQVLPSRVI